MHKKIEEDYWGNNRNNVKQLTKQKAESRLDKEGKEGSAGMGDIKMRVEGVEKSFPGVKALSGN